MCANTHARPLQRARTQRSNVLSPSTSSWAQHFHPFIPVIRFQILGRQYKTSTYAAWSSYGFVFIPIKPIYPPFRSLFGTTHTWTHYVIKRLIEELQRGLSAGSFRIRWNYYRTWNVNFNPSSFEQSKHENRRWFPFQSFSFHHSHFEWLTRALGNEQCDLIWNEIKENKPALIDARIITVPVKEKQEEKEGEEAVTWQSCTKLLYCFSMQLNNVCRSSNFSRLHRNNFVVRDIKMNEFFPSVRCRSLCTSISASLAMIRFELTIPFRRIASCTSCRAFMHSEIFVSAFFLFSFIAEKSSCPTKGGDRNWISWLFNRFRQNIFDKNHLTNTSVLVRWTFNS